MASRIIDGLILDMKRFLIAGLGNPGISYARHRHNVGFMVIDELARRQQVAFTRRRGKSLHADFRMSGAHILLAKPQTFMNQSGAALQSLIHYYRLPLQKTLIVFDDLDLPTAVLRLRPHGGSSGHKGMQSIIERLSSHRIPRLRIGIDRPPGRMDPTAYVLEPFADEQQELIEAVLPRAADAIEAFVRSGIESAMSVTNSAVHGE